MSEEILINISPMESRVALMDEGVLSEIYIERHNKLGLVGNIYLGTVVRVLPGMQAAFIDIGQQRTAFLHVNDMQKPKKNDNTTPQVQTTQSAMVISADSANVPSTQTSSLSTLAHISTEYQKANLLMSNSYSHLLADPHQPLSTNHFNTKTSHDNAASLSASISSIMPLNAASVSSKPSKIVADIHSPRINIQEPTQHHGQDSPISLDNMTAEYSSQAMTDNKANAIAMGNHALIDNVANMANVTADTLGNHNQPNKDEETLRDSKHADKSSQHVSEVINRTATFTPPRTLTTVRGEPTLPSSASKASKRPIKVNPEELIQNRLHEGQRILVQVTKDELGTKGARLTTQISLPSRYLVYIPSSEHIGISQRIDNETERQRLKDDLANLMQKVNLKGGIIARTAAEKVESHKLEEDIYYLLQLWRMVKERQQQLSQNHRSVLIYQELSLPFRALRDLIHPQTKKVVVDDLHTFDKLRHFAQEFMPMILPKLTLHESEQALFDIHRVEEDLKNALQRRVELKSGGYLIIDQTEAMTTIDVNTGSYVGGRSLEDTVYKTNLEATHAIARQLRLRNLGGIIILDFIDMQEQEHKDDVLSSLQRQLQLDYAKTNITQISELGLVEMTRKRTRESLEQLLCEPCSTCGGRGFVKTVETVCFEIFREIMRFARTYNNPKQFTVVAHASVIDLLLTSEADTVADLEYLLGRVITFEVEQLYTQEQYDIILD